MYDNLAPGQIACHTMNSSGASYLCVVLLIFAKMIYYVITAHINIFKEDDALCAKDIQCQRMSAYIVRRRSHSQA